MMTRSKPGLKGTAAGPWLLLLALLSISIAFGAVACASRRPVVTRVPLVQADTPVPPVTLSRQSAAEPAISYLWRDAVPPEAIETKHALESAEMPQRDLIDLTRRFKDPGKPIPRVTRDGPWGFSPGDSRRFWILNWDTKTYGPVTATLSHQTTHVNAFIQESIDLDEAKLKQLVDRFEAQTYPNSRQFFGQEWSPGVDGDPRLAILVGGPYGEHISGYQHSLDEYAGLVYPYSNEMEIVYITPGSVQENGDCLLAHEFAHLIQWATDRNETTWINEGLAELACLVNGYVSTNFEITLPAFARQPDVQLNAWSGDIGDAAAQYGAITMFMAYFRDRFGDQAAQALAAEPENGLDGVAATLESINGGPTLNDFFANWVVTNLIDDSGLADGRYSYSSLQLPPIDVTAEYTADDLPVRQQTEVSQYAADYIQFHGPGTFQVDFTGATLVRLASAPDRVSRYAWWGGRGQEGNATLTREFDLAGLQQATLLFDTWYDVEEDHDFAYGAVSTDGQHWTTLPGRKTREGDPNGANYGHGFTGKSAGWIEEKMDLTPYVGQKVQVRFEYVTDDGPVHNGIFVDDIRIPELSFYDDVESTGGDWEAHGFIRLANVMPQDWLLQLVTQTDEGATVEQLQLEPDNTGRWTVDLRSGETAVLLVSGVTRVTTEPAAYAYAIATGSQ
jgi:immune inhibitor A